MALKIVYWVSTALFCGFYLFSAYGYITQPEFWAGEYLKLGYPAYLVGLMTVVKIAGVVAVLVRRPVALAQLAYAGFFYHTALAAYADFQAGEAAIVLALGLLALSVVSFLTQNAARTPKAAYTPLA